ncbi:LysR family transcriptional regulator [Zhouia amylolytica]|uniref:LysR family transcriptional regulator n=1 Tax=Zhouia amylolytica AD3 TaxID=1286632 RepID=W2UP66_9FLAO|nr:LysR family transcriptional regulator [Zhouia amylolytica]ETN95773.1 LysR family transcriptional regulator [Zhouia amylolytica AD3]
MKNKLHIFKTVAHYNSFTKAAEQLSISQPAISKAVRTLEDTYKTTFFVRNRNAIELTDEGKAFLVYVNKILDVYAKIEEQFLTKKELFPERIQMGVSTTVGNYILPGVIAKFKTQFPQTNFKITSDNSENIEQLILNQQLDYGITEGKNTNPKLHFKKLIKDEIVLVTNAANRSFKNETITIETLKEINMVGRESGSGTKDIIASALRDHQVDQLHTVVSFNSTEAIKNYLYYSNDYALLSIHSVTEDLLNNKLKVIDIKGIAIERWFYFVCRTGYQSGTMDALENFIHNNYNF